jgi:predicted ATPase
VPDVPARERCTGEVCLECGFRLVVSCPSCDLEYTFKHALTHEVAYGSVLHDRRRAIHRRIVDALETLYPDRLAGQIERVAHHAFRAELWDKAVTYLRQEVPRRSCTPPTGKR